MRKTPVLLLILLGCGSSWAQAACSRPIVVPVSNIGQAVVIDGEVVTGVYPDILRDLGQKAGCNFLFPILPRARSDQMFFEAGTSDIVIPASYVAERAATATFIPLIKVLPSMVTVKALTTPPESVQQQLARSELRGAVVRSFTFGSEYQALIAALEKQGRVDIVNDIATVARMLLAGRVDFTILPQHLLRSPLDAASAQTDAKVGMYSFVLEGLPRIESGLYISRRSLSQADQNVLRRAFTTAAKSEVFVRGHQRYYPAEILKGVITRP